MEEKEFELNEFEANSIEDTTYQECMTSRYFENELEHYLYYGGEI